MLWLVAQRNQKRTEEKPEGPEKKRETQNKNQPEFLWKKRNDRERKRNQSKERERIEDKNFNGKVFRKDIGFLSCEATKS
jgi:hypothetical protein